MWTERSRDEAGSPAPSRLTHRVFLALWPHSEAVRALAGLAHDLAREVGGRATAAERLHLTVAFVPAATDAELAALRAVGEEAAQAGAPFVLTVDHLGTFRDSGVVWAAATELPQPLAHLAQHVRNGLVEHALPVDRRPYRPHFTLIRRSTGVLRKRTIAPVPCAFDALTLIESELAAAGPRYTVLERWPFGATVSRS